MRETMTIVCGEWSPENPKHTCAIIGLPIAIDKLVKLTKAFGKCWDCGAGLVLSSDPRRNIQVYDHLQPKMTLETRDFEAVLQARLTT